MTKTSEPVVFFGSGPVAAASLELLAQEFSIEAVVTKPRVKHHHGEVPVLELATKLGLKTFTASNKIELDELFAKRPVKSRLGVLIDFGIIVSQTVIDYFPLGIVNSHFSLLPQWRGADPITFAILSGQKQTGVSLMLLVEKMDEGPLLGYGEYELPADITTPVLSDGLIELSNALLKHHLPLYLKGGLELVPQTITGQAVSYSRKLTKEDGLIDWQKPAAQLERKIRAFVEWPKSRTTLADREVVITKAQVFDGKGKPGSVKTTNKQLIVYCRKQALEILALKPTGKPEMSAEAFLAGYKRFL